MAVKHLEAGLGEFQAGLGVVHTADGGDVATKFTEEFEPLFVRGGLVVELADEEEVAGHDPGGKLVGPGRGVGGLTDVHFGEQLSGLALGFAEAPPFGVAATPPLGEALFVDGATAEVGGQDGLDGGVGVEPFENGGAGLALFEAMVDGFAEALGKPGDFAVAGEVHGGKVFSVKCSV